jgi:iron-sulfur cluster assembly accessory protein
VLEITEIAAQKAKEILAAEGKASWGLRVYKAGESCCGPSYGLDINEHPLQTDDVLVKDGLKVFVDKDLMTGLAGMALDYYQDSEREGFIMTGGIPSCGADAGPSCGSGGCGSSCG